MCEEVDWEVLMIPESNMLLYLKKYARYLNVWKILDRLI